MNGFLCVDKCTGPSSFTIIKKVKKALSIKKVGHNGTLDPLASGLLVCAVGKATRLLPYLPSEPKEYMFTITFGSSTDTLDSQGKTTHQGGNIPSISEIAAVIPLFTGKITQVPPRYSALKVSGIPAYKMARENQVFKLKPRSVFIHSLSLSENRLKSGCVCMKTKCSGGTFIRSLARDIAEKLGTFGHISSLRRTSIGPFLVNNAINSDSIDKNIKNHVFSVAEAFSSFSSYIANEIEIKHLTSGRDIFLEGEYIDGQPVLIYNRENNLVAVARKTIENRYHPEKVLISS